MESISHPGSSGGPTTTRRVIGIFEQEINSRVYAGHQNTNLSSASSTSDLTIFEGARTGITEDIATNPLELPIGHPMRGILIVHYVSNDRLPHAPFSLPSSPVLMATE